MPLLEKGVQAVTNRMPKVISPKTHAIIDYAFIGSFVVAGLLAWKNHKKAAISCFITAGAEATTAMLTDFPGGVWPVISYRTHLKMDAGMSGLIGTMPNLMGFGSESPAWFFRSQAMSLAAVTGLSDTGETRYQQRYRRVA